MKAKKWEGSKADMAMDKKGAKKSGISMKKWENSPMDKKMDAKASMKMMSRKSKR